MGMTKLEVEKIINSKLQLYIRPDSAMKGVDSSLMHSYCKDCTIDYDGNYKEVNMHLTFNRNSRDSNSAYLLQFISVSSPTEIIETNYGIKTGLTEKEFIQICKQHNYVYFEFHKNKKAKVYGFYRTSEAAEMLIFTFSEGIISKIAVMNRVSD
jgi:hypothetical protein